MLAQNSARWAHMNFDGPDFMLVLGRTLPKHLLNEENIFIIGIYSFSCSLHQLSTAFNAPHSLGPRTQCDLSYHSLSANTINCYNRYGERNSRSHLHDNNGV